MGATAYSEAPSIGCAPTILPTTRLLEQHNDDDFLYVECASGHLILIHIIPESVPGDKVGSPRMSCQDGRYISSVPPF